MDYTLPLLLTLPWVAFLAFLVLGVRLPRPLPAPRSGDGEEVRWPMVSVVIPARNEARNIQRVVSSLAASDYPDFEIVVVDDRSEDATAELARSVGPGNASRILVLEGAELPEGWLGKPWACHQGARAARGDVLLFTDADTWHGPQLLRRAVQGMREDDAHLLTLAGRQLMLTFWERVVQPQIFAGMLVRFFDQRRPLEPDQWRRAIANGQYLMTPRQAYEAEGGHEALKGEVVEDLRMAQGWVRRGRRVSVRMAEDAFATRMYTSLRELVDGWSKNIVLGGLATLPGGAVRRWAPPVFIATGLIMWVAPLLVLLGAKAGLLGSAWELWSGVVVSVSVLTWALVSARMGVNAWYGLFYPLGSGTAAYIFTRAWRRGGEVEWKGRRYSLETERVMSEPEGKDSADPSP